MTEVSIVELLVLALNGGAGVVLYWFLEIPAVANFLDIVGIWTNGQLNLTRQFVKRVATFLASTGLGLLLQWALVALGQATWPVDPEGWINLILSLGLIYTVSQAAHLKDL